MQTSIHKLRVVGRGIMISGHGVITAGACSLNEGGLRRLKLVRSSLPDGDSGGGGDAFSLAMATD